MTIVIRQQMLVIGPTAATGLRVSANLTMTTRLRVSTNLSPTTRLRVSTYLSPTTCLRISTDCLVKPCNSLPCLTGASYSTNGRVVDGSSYFNVLDTTSMLDEVLAKLDMSSVNTCGYDGPRRAPAGGVRHSKPRGVSIYQLRNCFSFESGNGRFLLISVRPVSLNEIHGKIVINTRINCQIVLGYRFVGNGYTLASLFGLSNFPNVNLHVEKLLVHPEKQSRKKYVHYRSPRIGRSLSTWTNQ